MNERPFWLESAVACWGAPAIEHNAVRQRKRVNPETGHNQVEGVREWHWTNADGTPTWGIEMWDLGHRVRDKIVVVEAYGPMGSALRSRPGAHGDPDLRDVVLCLALAGIPVAHELLITACAALAGDLGDLTSQWRPTNVSSTATPVTEGVIMTEVENTETVNESNEVAPAEPNEAAAEVDTDTADEVSDEQ